MDPSISVQNKVQRKLIEAFKSSWSPIGNLKSFTLTIPWNLAKLVKIFPGIIVRQHHTDQKQMGLLKEQCAEKKKAPLPYCCNQVWMTIGGQIPWNALPNCETFKISCLMGRLHMRDVLGNHLKDRSFHLVHENLVSSAVEVNPMGKTTAEDSGKRSCEWMEWRGTVPSKT